MSFFFISLFVALVFLRPQEWLFEFLEGWPLLDVIFLMAMLGFFMELNEGRIRIPKKYPYIWLIAGVWVASNMSHIVHTYFAGLMATTVIVFKFVFFTIILVCTLDQPDRLRRIAILFATMSGVMVYNCWLQITTGMGMVYGLWPIPVHIPGEDPYVRTVFVGIFSDPNDLAQILQTSIPMIFAIPRRMGLFKFLGCSVMAAAVTWAMLTTHSRGGMVGMVAMFGLLVAGVLPYWLRRLALWGLLVGYLVMCPLSATHLDESARERVVFWGQANWVFVSTPLRTLFGVGTNMFSDFIPEDRAAHNAFVLCYTEMGIFGYWFWYGLLQVGIVGALRSGKALQSARTAEAKWMRRFSSLAVASVGGYMASAYFLSRAFVYPTFFLFALLAAIPPIVERMLPEGHPPLLNIKKDLFLWNTLGVVISILYIYYSIILLNKAYFSGGG